MKCDFCGCENASYVVKETLNGVTTTKHYCKNCVSSQTNINFFETTEFPFSHLFTTKSSALKEKELICPNCHLSVSQLKKIGRFGCSDCYETFYDILPYYLSRMQSGDRHHGKVYSREKDVVFNLEERNLKENLNLAIEEERYEEAAKLRDKIKALKEMENDG